jgi:hypothetical protein
MDHRRKLIRRQQPQGDQVFAQSPAFHQLTRQCRIDVGAGHKASPDK